MRLKVATAGTLVLAITALVPSSPALADSARAQQWYLKNLKVSEAQSISTGSGVTVGVIDTGVYPHRDFHQNLLTGINEESDENGNGQTDTDGHGTAMAGLIIGRGQSDEAMLGIAPNAKVLPIRLSHKPEDLPANLMGRGIDWAKSHHAGVISISQGTVPAFELVRAVRNAENANIVVVAAVGNDSSNLIAYPAAVEGVLAVGATDSNSKHMPLSNVGSAVQICAPGQKIFSTAPRDRYFNIEGTSASAAIVSGAVALVRAKFPALSASEVIHRITATADDVGPPGRDDECGFGELNIVKALTADVPPLGGPSATPSGTAAATQSAAAPATSADAAGPGDDGGSSAPLVVGVVVVVLLAAGLVGVVAVRRQRRG
jgi:type VII secretion-associated serine protease mycosin